jgi:hypothetical protein
MPGVDYKNENDENIDWENTSYYLSILSRKEFIKDEIIHGFFDFSR